MKQYGMSTVNMGFPLSVIKKSNYSEILEYGYVLLRIIQYYTFMSSLYLIHLNLDITRMCNVLSV